MEYSHDANTSSRDVTQLDFFGVLHIPNDTPVRVEDADGRVNTSLAEPMPEPSLSGIQQLPLFELPDTQDVEAD